MCHRCERKLAPSVTECGYNYRYVCAACLPNDWDEYCLGQDREYAPPPLSWEDEWENVTP